MNIRPRKDRGTGRTCGLCGTALTGENSSREHVIPNAIGGRKCVSNFLCVACNSTTGSEWDDELVRQLRPLCTMLNVKRAHGRNRPFVVETVSDRRLTLDPDGSMGIAVPLFEAQELAGKTTVKMHARTMRELKRMLSGLKKKHPQIDVDELMKQAEPVQEYSGEPYAIALSVGGTLAGRSMVKSCLTMVYDAGLTSDQCEDAEHYLLTGEKPCFGFYTKRDLVRNRPEKTFFHCVHVRGEPEQRQILAYVEYFGCLRFVAWLSSNYEGRAFSHCYAVNPVTGKEMDLDIVLDINPADLAEIDDGGSVDYDEVARALGRARGSLERDGHQPGTDPCHRRRNHVRMRRVRNQGRRHPVRRAGRTVCTGGFGSDDAISGSHGPSLPVDRGRQAGDPARAERPSHRARDRASEWVTKARAITAVVRLLRARDRPAMTTAVSWKWSGPGTDPPTDNLAHWG